MAVTTRMPLTAAPPIARTAEAVAEIKELYAAYEEAVKTNETNERVIQRLQDKISMLEEALQEERAGRRICERKLIRLATNQKNISRIAADGDEIMRSIQDWQDEEPPTGEIEEQIGDILERLPQNKSDETRTIPPANTP